jgi:hypothetical protein
MTDAVCDNRTHTRATRFAATIDVDCHKQLARNDQPDRASMTSGAPARPYGSTARAVGVQGLRASAPNARESQGTHMQPDRSEPHAHNHASGRPRSCSRTVAVAAHNTRQQLTAPVHRRGVMCRITPPELTRC